MGELSVEQPTVRNRNRTKTLINLLINYLFSEGGSNYASDRTELLDDLLKDYKKPEDLLGQDCLLEQLTKLMSSVFSTANLLINSATKSTTYQPPVAVLSILSVLIEVSEDLFQTLIPAVRASGRTLIRLGRAAMTAF
jgi:hypothetical protein